MGFTDVLGQQRAALVLLHPTSLPDPPGRPYGVGELGSEAFRFVDFLAQAETLCWQTLPLGHTGFKDSPYQTFSRFAGSPHMISVERLLETGDLSQEEHDAYCQRVRESGLPSEKVDYGWLFTNKLGGSWDDGQAVLRQAFANFEKRPAEDPRRRSFRAFRDRQGGATGWLTVYADFMAIKERHDQRDWAAWPEPYRDIDAWRQERTDILTNEYVLSRTTEFFQYLQFLFFEQWDALRRHAQAQGRLIIGDLPWYIGFDSADVWAHRGVFELDGDGRPLRVAGVPPDAFSDSGQLWGNPLYDWSNPEAIRWWVDSIRHTLGMVDILRLDHCRAADTYWVVSREWADQEGTARNGQWAKGPGRRLLEAIREGLLETGASGPGGQLPIIAEDLGCFDPLHATPGAYPPSFPEKHRYPLTPEFTALLRAGDVARAPGLDPATGEYSTRRGIDTLLDAFDLPLMRVLQFEMEGGRLFEPDRQPRNAVTYTGTHDNETALGWYLATAEAEKEGGAPPPPDGAIDERIHVSLGHEVCGKAEVTTDRETVEQMVELAWKSRSCLAGAPMQDLLGLGPEARMNQPGDAEGQWWAWRMTPGQAGIYADLAARLSDLGERCARQAPVASSLVEPPRTGRRRVLRDLVLQNRSYRRFHQDRPIDAETLRGLVDLARLCGSGANLQPLRFILSCEPTANARIFTCLTWAGYLGDWAGPDESEQPTGYIVVARDKKTATNASESDHGIAAQTILLGAAACGLGGCMIGSIDREKLNRELDLPLGLYEIQLVIALGEPKETVVIESVDRDDKIRYWRDAKGVHHVPKRSLDDVIVKTLE